jgi:regulator of sirC expression with transglutaminase-like and TPR domain
VDAASRFSILVGGPEEVLDSALDEAALLIAGHAHADLDVAAYRGKLDDLAAGVAGPDLGAVVDHVFGTEGFAGNAGAYDDPENSYLDSVIDRRLGIPITLSLVLMEVARRVGVPLAGIGMPHRFLVRYDGSAGGPVFIDSFGGGTQLDADTCAKRFSAEFAPGAPFDPAYLEPVGGRALLARMLLNLKMIHMARKKARDLAWVLRLRVAIPGVPLRERAELAQALHATGQFLEAADVLESAADLGTTEAAERLRSRARLLRARLN